MLGAHVGGADHAGSVLTGHGPAHLDREPVQPVGQLVRAAHLIRVCGVDEDRRVHVPVAEVPVEDDRDAQLLAHLARAAHGAGDLGERHGEVLSREDPVFSGMGQRRGGGEAAPRGP